MDLLLVRVWVCLFYTVDCVVLLQCVMFVMLCCAFVVCVFFAAGIG